MLILIVAHYLAAQGVLIPAGIVGSVVVFPMGLALLLTFCFCCSGQKSKNQIHKQLHNREFNNISPYTPRNVHV